MTAAKVGGIYANNYFPGEFIYDNLLIQSNIIESARVNKIKNFYLLDLLVFIQKLQATY